MYFLFRIFYFLARMNLLSRSYLIFYYLDFFRKPIVLKNLEIAFPEKSKKERIEIAKKTYKNFLTFFEDNVNENFSNIEIVNRKILEEAIKSNKPIILLTAHFGNWELSPKVITKEFNVQMAVVMREFQNEKIREFFKKIRSNENIKLINKRRSGKEIMKALLREKRVLGILIDQHTRNESAPVVNFFKPTRFNPAVSKLAKATKAIVIPGFSYKTDNRYVIEFHPYRTFEGSIEEFTQWQADEISEMIKKYPDQYYWFHNRWKERT